MLLGLGYLFGGIACLGLCLREAPFNGEVVVILELLDEPAFLAVFQPFRPGVKTIVTVSALWIIR